jgi:hypothetical protein
VRNLHHRLSRKVQPGRGAGSCSICHNLGAAESVIVWRTPANNIGTILRAGSNGWTCMPDQTGKPTRDPLCADETMMKWMRATFAERKPNIDRVEISYVLRGEAAADQKDLLVKVACPLI